MARCDKYRCKATSVHGLIQQVAVSYLRHGYWFYVTGTVPECLDPAEVDETILTKYDIRKCWRHRAQQKANGIANLQYIRFKNFYLIMATKGHHRFKQMEAKNIRDVRVTPILVPLEAAARRLGKKKRKKSKPSQFEGYAVSYVQGGYVKKTPEEREAYKEALAHWEAMRARGKHLPKPRLRERHSNWHAKVEIERRSFERLRAYFLEIATKRSVENLRYEFRALPYVPHGLYRPVLQQLGRLVREVNGKRKGQGLDLVPWLGLRRKPLAPFRAPEPDEREGSKLADAA